MLSNVRAISKPLQRALCPLSRQAIHRSLPSRSNQFRSESAVRTIFSTPALEEKQTINVPTMGDSITDGTIVEWVAPEGTAVAEGDVICLIETDKVTVDIKAEKDGVVVQHLGEVEGVVEVGEGLYVLDTDLSAATSAGVAVEKEAQSAVEKTSEKVEEAPTPVAAPSPSTRVPSIQFLGKEGWNALRNKTSQSPSTAVSSGTTIVANAKPQSPTSITYQPYVHMFGRPSITDEEMEALMLGGAEEAPVMKKEKSGVVSFYGGKVVTAGPRGVWLAEEKM